MKQGEVIYYRDEVNDDFAGNDINAVKVTKDFPFLRKGALWKIAAFIAYYLIAWPIVWLILFAFSGYSVKNRRAMRKLVKTSRKGFFIFANHTGWTDAFLAPVLTWPRKAHVLVSPDTVSIKGLRAVVQMLGAIPVPTERDAFPPFMEAIDAHINAGDPVMIFPEAHIWPYCTFVRDFKAGSFRYPVNNGVPAIAVCTTYTRHRGLLRFLKSPRRVVYISEPFFPDASLPSPEAKMKLRNEVYAWLKKTAGEHSDYEYVKYAKRTD